MTDQDLAILDKMQALMAAAHAQAEAFRPIVSIQDYRCQCFVIIEPQFWALANQLSFKRNYIRGGGVENKMTAFMLAHDPITSKWFTDALEQLGLQEPTPSEDTTHE